MSIWRIPTTFEAIHPHIVVSFDMGTSNSGQGGSQVSRVPHALNAPGPCSQFTKGNRFLLVFSWVPGPNLELGYENPQESPGIVRAWQEEVWPEEWMKEGGREPLTVVEY